MEMVYSGTCSQRNERSFSLSSGMGSPISRWTTLELSEELATRSYWHIGVVIWAALHWPIKSCMVQRWQFENKSNILFGRLCTVTSWWKTIIEEGENQSAQWAGWHLFSLQCWRNWTTMRTLRSECVWLVGSGQWLGHMVRQMDNEKLDY